MGKTLKNKFLNEQKVLNGKFNIELHKQTFINYLEVVVRKDGTVEYAVPSHQEKLIAIANEMGYNREWLDKNCPREYYFNFMQWMCNLTGCVSLWFDYKISPEQGRTPEQNKAIWELVKAEVYKGAF